MSAVCATCAPQDISLFSRSTCISLPTILLIHGAWMNSTCWEGFQARYNAAGYTTLAPSWPHLSDDVQAARTSPDPALAAVGLPEIVERYAAVIRAQPGPVVLIGHSFGGLVVQLLLDRGLGVAGVAIDSAPPQGVLPSWSALRASFWPSLGASRLHTMSRENFARDFANTSPEATQNALYERYAVQSPGKPFSQLVGGSAAKIDWKNGQRGPLLLIAGEKDLTVTAAMNRSNAARWEKSAALTELVVMPGRDHSLIVAPGWEEVADQAIGWLEKNAPR